MTTPTDDTDVYAWALAQMLAEDFCPEACSLS
jgi:hypothetical protein